MRKLFVLDTNVPLHDWNCCVSFQEHDIAIPIEVLSEIDQFKKGLEPINYNARHFIKFLDSLSSDKLFDGGAPLGEGLGKIRIVVGFSYKNEIKRIFPEQTVDNKIINTVYCLSKQKKDAKEDTAVIFVSKDINLRVKAKSLRLKAEDYKTDIVSDVNSLYKDIKVITTTDEDINNLYSKGKINFHVEEKPHENEFMILNSDSKKTALSVYKSNEAHLILKDKVSPLGVRSKNSEQAFALSALLDPDISLVTLMGKAGTGKTILSLAAGIQQLDEKRYDQVFFTRQTISLGNREIGFLPGDTKEKISPFMQGMHDNLSVIKNISKGNMEKIKKLLLSEEIIIEALSYLRGRSLLKKFFIVDEAQNLTPQEAKAIITRAGEGTKIVLIGDITQIDHPFLDERSNGLSYIISRMRGQDLYAHVVLKKGERSRLAEIAGNLL